jgi:hypothetical protein
MGGMTRRQFLATPAIAVQRSPTSWNAGLVRHLLPGANHHRILLKSSFDQPLARSPVLRVGSRRQPGFRTDTQGLFWAFDVDRLEPATSYELQLHDDAGRALCDPWPLRTLPDPESTPERFRLFIYTCAGGHDAIRIPNTDQPYWVSLQNRRKMLAAGLALQPDAVIANGDHVYWDLRIGNGPRTLGASPIAKKLVGEFQRDIPVLGTTNEQKLRLAVGPQIADLYGTLFRSVPVHFLQDDHDHFENDEARDTGITFPPDDFMVRLARATQYLYYPEFLPADGRPLGLPGSAPGDRPAGVSESYGTLRYGRLAEILLYDCRRHLSLKGPHAGFVPDVVENWLVGRMRESPARHVVNVPSTPIAWSAGKWGEWYPDLLGDDGRLTTAKPKYFWQTGWRSQHDRLLEACSAMSRTPLFISGDLHALAHGRILRNGTADLRRNPVISVLSGPISTGPRGWPSAARGTPPRVPNGLEVEESLAPLEHNGFTVADFFADRIEFQMFRWKIGRPESELDDLRPFYRFTLRRPA